MSYPEIIITAVIVGLVLFVAFGSGQANPVSTGRLSRRLSALESTVAAQGVQITSIELSLDKLAESLEDNGTALQALRVEIAADRGLTERTWAAVDRLQHFFIEDAFKHRGKP